MTFQGNTHFSRAAHSNKIMLALTFKINILGFSPKQSGLIQKWGGSQSRTSKLRQKHRRTAHRGEGAHSLREEEKEARGLVWNQWTLEKSQGSGW